MATPSARAAIVSSPRCASSSGGVGRVQHRAREHALGQVVVALEADAAAPQVISPLQNRNSSARLASDQSHHGPFFFGASSTTSPPRIGPRSRTLSSTRSTSSGRSVAMRRIPPQASSCARFMRQRSSGWVATGISDASWPQYSNSRRGA